MAGAMATKKAARLVAAMACQRAVCWVAQKGGLWGEQMVASLAVLWEMLMADRMVCTSERSGVACSGPHWVGMWDGRWVEPKGSLWVVYWAVSKAVVRAAY